MTEGTFVYEGQELELFAHALNWKSYWSTLIKGYLGKRVLEVGAGMGANTPYLNSNAAEWVCLEPDERLAASIEFASGHDAVSDACGEGWNGFRPSNDSAL